MTRHLTGIFRLRESTKAACHRRPNKTSQTGKDASEAARVDQFWVIAQVAKAVTPIGPTYPFCTATTQELVETGKDW
jgi:hypothetical protein